MLFPNHREICENPAVINIPPQNSPIDPFISKLNPQYHHSVYGNHLTNSVYNMINLMHMLQYTSDKTDLIWNVNNNIKTKCSKIDKMINELQSTFFDQDEETDSENEIDDQMKSNKSKNMNEKNKKNRNKPNKQKVGNSSNNSDNKGNKLISNKQNKHKSSVRNNEDGDLPHSNSNPSNNNNKSDKNAIKSIDNLTAQFESQVKQLISEYSKLYTHIESNIKFNNQIKEMNDVFSDVMATLLYGNIVDSANYFQQLKERGAIFAYILFEIVKYKENGMNEERTTTVRAIEKYEILEQEMKNMAVTNEQQLNNLNKQLQQSQNENAKLQLALSNQEKELTCLSLFELKTKAQQQRLKSNSNRNKSSKSAINQHNTSNNDIFNQ